MSSLIKSSIQPKRILLTQLTIIYTLLWSCTKTDLAYEKLSSQGVILAFGDSLTHGTGTSKNKSYPSILSQLSGHKVVNAGRPGEISHDGVRRLPRLLDKHQPELLILIHGGNDILKKMPLNETKNNLEKMITAAQERQIQVVLLGVPQPALFSLSSAQIYPQIASETETAVDVDILPEILSENQLKSDRVHPNAAGYKRLAVGIFNLLKTLGVL